MANDSVADQVRAALALDEDDFADAIGIRFNGSRWGKIADTATAEGARLMLASLLAENEAMAKERDKAVLTIISDAVPVYADAAVVGEHVGLPAAVHVVQQLIRYAKEQKAEADRLGDEQAEADLARVTQERDEIKAAWNELTGHAEADAPLPERIKREFDDFRMVMDHCSQIYDWATNGRVSKCDTLPSEVQAIAEDLETQRTEEAVREATEELRQDVDRLEGQLTAIAEDGTSEHNAAVRLRSHLAQARIERDTADTACRDMYLRLTRVVEGHKQMQAERDVLQSEVDRLTREKGVLFLLTDGRQMTGGALCEAVEQLETQRDEAIGECVGTEDAPNWNLLSAVQRLTWKLTLAHSAYKAEAAQHTETIKEFVLERKRAEQAEARRRELAARVEAFEMIERIEAEVDEPEREPTPEEVAEGHRIGREIAFKMLDKYAPDYKRDLERLTAALRWHREANDHAYEVLGMITETDTDQLADEIANARESLRQADLGETKA